VKYSVTSKFRIVLLLLLAVQASCISRKRVLSQDERLLPAKNATREELLHQIEERSNSIQTLQGTIFLDLSGGGAKSGVLTEYHQTTAYVVVDRPQQIRFKVVVPIVLSTIADMVSDGRQVRVSIPLKNQFVVGSASEPLVTKTALANLRPQHLLDGMFVDIRPYLKNPRVKALMEESVQGRRSYYVFSFIDISGDYAELLEKLWIDRTDMQISRKELFGKDGRVETEVEYSNYQADGENLFPHTIMIQRPVEEYTLKMAFQKATLNQKLSEDAFNLQRPEGSDLVQVAR
jgi:outer membrane lipoprotein-sorting protein